MEKVHHSSAGLLCFLCLLNPFLGFHLCDTSTLLRTGDVTAIFLDFRYVALADLQQDDGSDRSADSSAQQN